MLERLRVNKGITCTFVAKELKISRDRLRKIEREESQLPAEFIPFFSKLYGVGYIELIDGRGKNERDSKKTNKRFRQA